MDNRRQRYLRTIRGAWLLVALALVCPPAYADTRVYLLRGWFGVFSTGLDQMAEDLRRAGIRAEVIGHLQWKSTADAIAKERASGATGQRLALVGHSQGGNDAIKLARELERHRVTVDLVITLVPFRQDPVPGNVALAINYYQSPGWGSPLVAVPGSKGEIRNVDIGNDGGTFHVNIDKNAKVQAAVVEAIAGLAGS